MKILSTIEAIKRLREFCRENDYTISTRDTTASSLKDNILSFDSLGEIADRYKIYADYNERQFILAEGSLLEMFYDFGLLGNEMIETDSIQSFDGYIPRRNTVRLPWERSHD